MSKLAALALQSAISRWCEVTTSHETSQRDVDEVVWSNHCSATEAKLAFPGWFTRSTNAKLTWKRFRPAVGGSHLCQFRTKLLSLSLVGLASIRKWGLQDSLTVHFSISDGFQLSVYFSVMDGHMQRHLWGDVRHSPQKEQPLAHQVDPDGQLGLRNLGHIDTHSLHFHVILFQISQTLRAW